MTEVPLTAIPAQSLQILLDEQECTIAVYQRNPLREAEPAPNFRSLVAPHLYLDLDVDGERIATGAICQEGVSIIQAPKAQFTGSLHFVDLMGRAAPQWAGLGTRWVMVYLNAGEAFPERLRY